MRINAEMVVGGYKPLGSKAGAKSPTKNGDTLRHPLYVNVINKYKREVFFITYISTSRTGTGLSPPTKLSAFCRRIKFWRAL